MITDLFETACCEGVSERTAHFYRAHLDHFRQWLGNYARDVLSARPVHLHLYTRDLQKDYAPNTIRQRLSVLRRFYQFLADRDDVPHSLPDHLYPPSPVRRKWPSVNLLESHPVDLSDPTGRGYRNQAILALHLAHRMPSTEIAALTVGECRVYDNLTGWVYVAKRQQTITLRMPSYWYLRAWLDVRDVLNLLSNALFPPLPANGDDVALSPRGVRYVINSYLKEVHA
jgi:site-specific recombinase XerD